MTTKWMARKRAQRDLPSLGGITCENCKIEDAKERHHPDYANVDVYQVLCRPCHVEADKRDGHRRTKQEKRCKVCGKMFIPNHSKKHTTCSRNCLSEIGRLNAMKRWDNGPLENGQRQKQEVTEIQDRQ